MKVYSAETTARLLPYPELAEVIADILVDPAINAPPRTILPLPGDGLLLMMPASDAALTITKLVTVHPENAQRGLPTVQSDVLVMDAKTGERMGLLDGATVTARRTAALSLLAAKRLAAEPEGTLLLIGAGVQARAHLEAFRAGLGTASVIVSSRTPANARALAEEARRLGMSAHLEADPDEATREASLIVTATTSKQPLLKRPLRPGQFVSAVGAFTPTMAELSDEIVASSRVVVDTLEGARAEAGELIQAAASGDWQWERATELEAHLRSTGRDAARATIFKSVGHAMFDLAACKLLVARAEL